MNNKHWILIEAHGLTHRPADYRIIDMYLMSSDKAIVFGAWIDSDLMLSNPQWNENAYRQATIFNTTDGGHTWSEISHGPGMLFASKVKETFFVVKTYLSETRPSLGLDPNIKSPRSSLYKSNDYGTTLQLLYDFDFKLTGVWFFDEKTGIVFRQSPESERTDSALLHGLITMDGGNSWDAVRNRHPMQSKGSTVDLARRLIWFFSDAHLSWFDPIKQREGQLSLPNTLQTTTPQTMFRVVRIDDQGRAWIFAGDPEDEWAMRIYRQSLKNEEFHLVSVFDDGFLPKQAFFFDTTITLIGLSAETEPLFNTYIPVIKRSEDDGASWVTEHLPLPASQFPQAAPAAALNADIIWAWSRYPRLFQRR